MSVQVVNLPYSKDAYQIEKESHVEPKQVTRETSVSLPNDPATLAEIERQKQAIAKAYGVNPTTGEATPFEILGYKPEEERKRREAERALNDRKRKENAWYNAFAVLGDSLTAALGGNVWKRNPNNIGAKANADNERLIAEQRAEDAANQAKLNAASAGYANAVQKLVQNYLTKSTKTDTTGGSRTETINHPEQSGVRSVSRQIGEGDGGSNSGSGRKSEKYININATNKDGSKTKERYTVTPSQYSALIGILKQHYTNILDKNDEHAQKLYDQLIRDHVLEGTNSDGQYLFDEDQLLQNGNYYMLDDATRDRIEREIGGKAKFRRGSQQSPSSNNTPPYKRKQNNSNENIPPYKRDK